MWLGVYGVTFFFLARRRQLLQIALKDKPIQMLLVLVIFSIIWSAAPPVTLIGGIALLGTTLLGVYLVISFTRQEILFLLLWALGLSAALSIGVAILMPEYAYVYDGGPLRGFFASNNHLGPMMCLGALTWLIYAIGYKKLNPAGFICYAVFIALLYLSCSATAILMFIMLLTGIMIFRLVRRPFFRKTPVVLIALFTSGIVIWLISSNIEALLAVLGKSVTLTGRTQLWQVARDMIRQQPWLGYGYNAFWLGYQGPSSYIWHALHWNPPNAHNGFMDIWLQLGLVGLVIFMVSLIRNLLRAFSQAYRSSDWRAMFPLIFLVFLIIHNLTESTLISRHSIQWILYVVISIQLWAEWSGRPQWDHKKMGGRCE